MVNADFGGKSKNFGGKTRFHRALGQLLWYFYDGLDTF